MQVHHLKQLLVSRHPASLPAAAVAAAAAAAHPAESAALTAAESTIQQLQDQLDLQQQQHEHGLRALQQQYEALKVRLEQRQAKEEVRGVTCKLCRRGAADCSPDNPACARWSMVEADLHQHLGLSDWYG